MKIYIVMSSYCLGNWYIERVYNDKEKAMKYVEVRRNNEDSLYYNYKIDEKEVE